MWQRPLHGLVDQVDQPPCGLDTPQCSQRAQQLLTGLNTPPLRASGREKFDDLEIFQTLQCRNRNQTGGVINYA